MVLAALASGCGSGGADGLFTQPSSNAGGGADGGAAHAGASSHAGAPHQSGGAGGASNATGGAGASSEAGAAHGGATAQAGAATAQAGAATTAQAGAATAGSPSSGGGGAGGGAHAGEGGSLAGGAGAPAGGGGAGGAMAGAGGGAGAPCVDNGTCANDEYCAKPSCAAKAEGHCAPTPSDCGNTKLAVVCGCDGVTYHDACLLHQARQNASALDNGACSKMLDTTVTCTEVDAQKCTLLGGVCGFKAENVCIAVGPGNTGTCWVLPASCPGSDDKTAQTCLAENTSCTSECDAIKNGQRYALPDLCN